MNLTNFFLLRGGYSIQHERLSLRTGLWKKIQFPSLFSLFKHDKLGPILFDTGYSPHLFDACQVLPYSIYPKVMSVHLPKNEAPAQQLSSLNIAAKSVKSIIISHFHPDHIAGLQAFPNAEFIASSYEYEFVKNRRGLSAIPPVFLPGLIPNDFESRFRPIEQCPRLDISDFLPPFKTGFDIFGDQHVIAVSLPGHSSGQFGLYLEADGIPYFLAADACWSCKAYRENVPPSKLAAFFFHEWNAYLKTLEQLHILSIAKPNIRIIPSHCNEAFHKWGTHV